jgi:alkylhydroperoxidase family enzyme
VPARLRATFGLIEAMVRRPDAITAADIDAVRAAGVSDAAIRDAAYVCALFSTIVRVADALDWAIPASFDGSRTALVKFGYRLPPLL